MSPLHHYLHRHPYANTTHVQPVTTYLVGLTFFTLSLSCRALITADHSPRVVESTNGKNGNEQRQQAKGSGNNGSGNNGNKRRCSA